MSDPQTNSETHVENEYLPMMIVSITGKILTGDDISVIEKQFHDHVEYLEIQNAFLKKNIKILKHYRTVQEEMSLHSRKKYEISSEKFHVTSEINGLTRNINDLQWKADRWQQEKLNLEDELLQFPTRYHQQLQEYEHDQDRHLDSSQQILGVIARRKDLNRQIEELDTKHAEVTPQIYEFTMARDALRDQFKNLEIAFQETELAHLKTTSRSDKLKLRRDESQQQLNLLESSRPQELQILG